VAARAQQRDGLPYVGLLIAYVFYLLFPSIAIEATTSIVLAASPPEKSFRSNDLSAVLADMDDGNREGNAAVPITATMKNDGIELVIHRLTLGRRLFKSVDGRQVDDADSSYADRAKQAFASKILFGAYHVLFPSPTGEDNGVEQARGFLSAIKDRCVVGQELILAVDWESTRCGGKSCGIPEPKYIASFLPAVRKVTGKPVLVYTSPDILSTYADEIKPGSDVGEVLRSNPLWLASYYSAFSFIREAKQNKIRMGFVFPLSDQLAPWDSWTFWQFAASEDAKGPSPSHSVFLTVQNHRIDLSWFAGAREEFYKFYNEHAVKCDAIDPSKL
jgi:GH25 family lysozyme M1 (1,4-beta-N-acetylmuramidase)